MFAQKLKRGLMTLCLTTLASAACADVAVIVNPSAKIASMSQDEVSELFLGKVQALKDGSKAEPIDQSAGKAIRSEFYQKVLNKSDSQISAYWSRIIFTGKGQAPSEKGDDQGVKDAVAKNPQYVGYIDAGKVDASVKVVYRQ